MVNATKPLAVDPRAVDQRVYLHGVSWADYERLVEMRGDDPGVRMTYLEGELEIMSPSTYHERLKTRWARLLEAWSEEVGIDLEGIGSWTIRSELKRRGLEPDECYFLGGHKPEAKAPDLALEVVWTSGGLDKLQVYAGLGVTEVWYWRDTRISFHALRGDRYEEIARSELLPALDPELIAGLLDADSSQAEAIRTLRAAVRATRSR
jgi:Uma2 family endonuclease